MENFLVNYVPPLKKLKESNVNRVEQQKKYEEGNRKRKFLTKWLDEFKWLKDTEKGMTCEVCVQFGSSGSFVIGCTNYKKDNIHAHEKSDIHNFNVKKLSAKSDKGDSVATKTLKSLNQQTISQLVYKFRNAHYLSRKGRPFTDYTLLCQLDEAKGINIGSQYRSDKSCAEFSHFIAEAEKFKIQKSIENSKFISIISDGTTDSSYQEAEIVFIRSCKAGRVDVYFSLVKNVPKGDAETISKVMIEGAKNLAGDDFAKKLVATGTDGASTMLGKNSGAVQRIRDLLDKPWLIGVHCSGHKLELSFKDAVKSKVPLFVKVDCLLLNIYYFYRNSNLNRATLKESFKTLNQKVILPTRTGGTRWVGHLKKAIECFIRGYKAIMLHLGQLQNRDSSVSRTEKGNKAKNFFTIGMSKSFWLMVHFLLDVLGVLVDISKKFQEKTATLGDIMNEIDSGIKCLEKLKTSAGFHLRNGIASQPDALTGNDTSFKSARIKFLEAIVDGLQKRFTDNPGILNSCSIVNLGLFPSKEENEAYGEEEVQELVDYFKVPLETAGVEVSKCEVEWGKLVDNMYARFKKPTEATWEEINLKFEALYPNILTLIDLILTIPASSADAERGFNRLKLTKDDFRSKLSHSNLTDQMMIMLESQPITEYDPMPAINIWNSTPRRVREKKTVEPYVPIANANQNQENEIENNPNNSTNNEVLNDSMDDEIVEDYESDEDYEFETLEDELELAKDDYKNRLSDAVDAYTHLCKMMDLN